MAPAHGVRSRLRRRFVHPLRVIGGSAAALVLAVAALVALTGDRASEPPTDAAGTSLTPLAPPEPLAADGAVLPSSIERGLEIRTVPAVRDFQVVVDGTTFATDAEGVIAEPRLRGRVSVQVLGYRAEPPLLGVTFRGWSDGSTDLDRDIDLDTTGPLQIGVETAYRATVLVGDDDGLVANVAPQRFGSALGTVALRPGEPTWVTAQWAEPTEGGFIARTVEYAYEDDRSQVFTATPEVLWSVRPARP